MGMLCQDTEREQHKELEEWLGCSEGFGRERGSQGQFECPQEMPRGSRLCLPTALG